MGKLHRLRRAIEKDPDSFIMRDYHEWVNDRRIDKNKSYNKGLVATGARLIRAKPHYYLLDALDDESLLDLYESAYIDVLTGITA